MKSVNKTKKELIDELEALEERVSELERHEKNSRQALDFEERTDRSFPQTTHMPEAMFVVFDRKYEFVNDNFAELFGVSPEEACSSNFDPMTLIAPESRSFIREQYREWCRGAFKTKQFNYTGLSKDGLKIECETFLRFIPYKWGISIQGTLRDISVGRKIDATFPRRHRNLPDIVNAVPAGVLYCGGDQLGMQKNKTIGKSSGFPMEQIPRGNYPVRPAHGAAL